MARQSYPKNECIRNRRLAEWYLFCLRRKWRLPAKFLGQLLSCEITCEVPERLFLPHPTGIITGNNSVIHNDVVLLQQVTLGCRSAYAGVMENDGDPTLKEGVYVGPGARILGRITVGEWSIIGANAVVTENIPPYSIVVGHNKVLPTKTNEFKAIERAIKK